jgi:hypothetical protein
VVNGAHETHPRSHLQHERVMDPSNYIAYCNRGSEIGDRLLDFAERIVFDNRRALLALFIVLTRGDDKRHVFHFFDKIPTDDRLKELFCPITIGQGREQMMFDTTQRRVMIPTQ